MKKYISFLFFIFTIQLAVVGQQDPQFTNNAFYKFGSNPGVAGSEEAINGLILNRYQWVGFDGAPETLVFSVEGPTNVFGHPGGLGINVISDKLGYEENTWVNFSYSYKKTMNLGDLGIGIAAGFYHKALDITDGWVTSDDMLSGLDGYSGSDASGDDVIPEGESSQLAFDLGLGLYLKASNYFVGASVTHINQAAIYFDNEASAYLTRHYYLSGGYNIKLPDPLFELRPFILVKSDLASTQVDLNAIMVYSGRFWGGLNYRYQDAISILLGGELFSGLKFGYSFDITTSALARYGYGSHEIFLGYSFELERNRTRKYKSIRYL